MGREIRRVPEGWEHPRDTRSGEYLPMYDRDYETAAREWIENFHLWERGEHPDQVDYCRYYWEYENIPDESYCRPAFEAEPTCYQIYQTVSEGTPVSPVFRTTDELIAWLVENGYSQIAAEKFAQGGWAPSMTSYVENGRVVIRSDIHSLETAER